MGLKMLKYKSISDIKTADFNMAVVVNIYNNYNK